MSEETGASLGSAIDALYATRQKRLELTKEVNALKASEVEMREQILERLDASGLAKASGALATCGITTTIEPVVEDWDKVYDYIKQNDRFDLVQKRISVLAWRELHNEGIAVPGTEPMTVTDVSLTKSTRG